MTTRPVAIRFARPCRRLLALLSLAGALSACATSTAPAPRPLISPLEQSLKNQEQRLTALEQRLAQFDQGLTALGERLDQLEQQPQTAAVNPAPLAVVAEPAAATAAASQETAQPPSELYRLGFAAYTVGDHGTAARLFERFCNAYPTHDYAANARYWQGEAYRALNQPQLAQAAYRDLLELAPEAQKAPFALQRLAELAAASGDQAQEHQLLLQLQQTYPDSDVARQLARRRPAPGP
ncbi:MAG: tetratricopeptide repeat protein [Desulfuromonas thiophila]|nr:tetratricopeptide repeat protein [Desulfuromonas thiophila]